MFPMYTIYCKIAPSAKPGSLSQGGSQLTRACRKIGIEYFIDLESRL